MNNYSQNMNELKCRHCAKWYITKEYFRKVKDGSGFAPNCLCQSGSGDIGGSWIEVPESDLRGYEAGRQEGMMEL